MKQQELFNLKHLKKLTHGGQTSHAKWARPLDKKKWLHLVLKSKRAKGKWSFLNYKNRIWLERFLKIKAKKFGITIGDYANVGNHLHIKIKIHNRELFKKFLISITTGIVRHITKARRGQKIGRFWDGLAFTRVLKTYTENLRLKGYFTANRLEAHNGRAAREHFLKKF